ncbi:glycoside hydrolase family protein [Cohnella endophytica]|uniref:hypothetical protein n=1 Tax=Cohnella endophytica TaxID=2419778 RepID=UPI0018F54447|nr:hypothetical protein [Cohnella endophytica]
MRKMLARLLLPGAMLLFVLSGCTSSDSPPNADISSGNPIYTSIFTADPSAHV